MVTSHDSSRVTEVMVLVMAALPGRRGNGRSGSLRITGIPRRLVGEEVSVREARSNDAGCEWNVE